MSELGRKIISLQKLYGFIFVLLFCVAKPASATHIVGAELYYECISPQTDQYRVTLRLLRDCLTGQAPFDDEISLFVFPAANPNNFRLETILQPVDTPYVEPEAWDSCVASLYNLCVQEAYYQKVITLPARTGGYNLGWARCCRNANITNLTAPLSQGVTFLAHVPGPEDADCNNMPYFRNQMPIFICADEDFYFDHSAIDADGDSLVYSLSNPYDGLSVQGFGAGNPTYGGPSPVVNAVNTMGPPPYRNVNFGFGYSGNFPFGTTSTATIDPQTGYLHFNPRNPGIYVIALSVKEYRNGVLLSENKRDFQVHAVNCRALNPPPVISHDFTGLISNGDTIFTQARDNFCYRVTVRDSFPTDSLEAKGISAIFGSANPFPPNATVTFSGSNPLFADICWTPSCEFVGDTVQVIVAARDFFDCPYYNNVFDTIFIVIQPTPPNFPLIDKDLSGTNFNGDTLTVEVDSAFCFEWWILDTLGSGGPLTYTTQIQTLSSGPSISPQFSANSTPDSVGLDVCWVPTCDSRGHLYRMILTGTDQSTCPPFNFAKDTLYLRIPELPNPAPVISHDLAGNIFNGDTILIDVHDSLCFEVTLVDTFPANLAISTNISALDGGANVGASINTNLITSLDSIVMEVCWYPTCVNVDRTFQIITRGTQLNRCNMLRDVFDTVFVKVAAVQNPPPVITHSFLPGFTVSGDTIIIAADSAACYAFSAQDTAGEESNLEVTFEGFVLPQGNLNSSSIDLTIQTQTPRLIEGIVCIQPNCELVDETLMIIATARDTFDCDISNIVYDTVFIRVIEPDNNPPTIQHFLNGLNVSGGIVQSIPQADSYCYTIELTDPDPGAAPLTAEGANDIFTFDFRYGNPAEITYSGSNPLNMEVCWAPSCYDSENQFEIIVCGRDTSRCGLTPEVCDTVRFFVEPCSLEIGNVFTPNGDGINETFEPFSVQGVDYYDLVIYDRWGRTMFNASNQGWDGRLGGQEVPEGVYYYILEYQFFSARGVPLKDTQVGWVTLMR